MNVKKYTFFKFLHNVRSRQFQRGECKCQSENISSSYTNIPIISFTHFWGEIVFLLPFLRQCIIIILFLFLLFKKKYTTNEAEANLLPSVNLHQVYFLKVPFTWAKYTLVANLHPEFNITHGYNLCIWTWLYLRFTLHLRNDWFLRFTSLKSWIENCYCFLISSSVGDNEIYLDKIVLRDTRDKSDTNFGGQNTCNRRRVLRFPANITQNEPTHEIMALFVLRTLILQTRMRSHPVGLDVWFWSDPSSIFILHVYEQRRVWWDCADAQARLSLRWSPMW